MNELTRRGFLYKTTALVAGLPIAHYLEPFVRLPTQYKDWIEDKGDFFVVRVPEGKRLEGQTFDKPTILLLGALASFKSNTVKGYLNVFAPNQGAILDSTIDATGFAVSRERPVLELKGTRFLLSRSRIVSSAIPEGNFYAGMRMLEGHAE